MQFSFFHHGIFYEKYIFSVFSLLLWKFGRTQKALRTHIFRFVIPQHFSISQTSTHVSIKQIDYGLRFLSHASWQGPRQSQLSPMEIKSELSKLLFTYKSTSHWKLYLVRQTLWKHQETAAILLTSTHCYFTHYLSQNRSWVTFRRRDSGNYHSIM